MMKGLILAGLLIFCCSSCNMPVKASRVFLVILAHPDDETTIGPVMARYAVDNKVIYMVASDGRYGTRLKKIAEDSLIQIRKAECQCSATALGIDSLVMLGFHDNLGLQTGIGEYFKQTSQLRDTLSNAIETIDPDVIITFGPDGDTGHSDHRIVGDIVTEIILRRGWIEQYPVYYLGWTKKQASKFGIEELSFLDEKYFNVAVHFDQEDERKYFKSIQCYKSQNTEQEITDWINADERDSTNVSFFRRLSSDKSVTMDF